MNRSGRRSYAASVLARAHLWLDRHPGAADAALAAVLLALAVSTLLSARTDAGAADVVLTVALLAPLALRRRWPVAVFAAVMITCGVELLIVDDFLFANIGALIALYTLVAHAPRRLAAIGCGVALAGTVPFALRFDDVATVGTVFTWLVLALHVALAAALGDRMHARLADREALELRARTLAAERDLAAATERGRIARELHDVVAHTLSVVIAQADGGRYAAAQDPEAATAALRTIAAAAREAQAEMRHALGALGDRPDAPMAPQPGVEDLDALVERMRDAGLTVEVAEDGPRRPLMPAAGLTVYRVAQEALTNVLKHAGRGACARLGLRWDDDRVTLVVRDDGTARTGAAQHGGRGLAGMRERLEPRGGTLRAGPRPDGGFEVRAEIPTGPGAPARA